MKFPQLQAGYCGDGRRLRPNREVKHVRSPSIIFPVEKLETGMRFPPFFKSLTRSWRNRDCNLLAPLTFSSACKCREPDLRALHC